MSSASELEELRSAVRDFLDQKATPDAERYDPQLWSRLAGELRLPALAIPEQYGGDGFGLVELGVAMAEAGRVLLPSPFFATAALAAPALLASGDRQACARYLPDLAAGRTTATLAVAESDGSWAPERVSTRAVRDADGWVLTGEKYFVVDGTTADLLLVAARTDDGPSLFAVDRRAAGLRAEAMPVLDSTRPLAKLILRSTPAAMIGAAHSIVDAVLDVAYVALAAEQAGGARRCLEMSAGYARDRYQFGRPIGSFQAVKHKCADMLVQVELAEAAVREAARIAGSDAGAFPLAAVTAHASCSRAYLFVAMENIQVHGGIGFTWEHQAHRYFRRAKSAQLLFGGPAAYLEKVLDRLGIGEE